MRGNLNKKVFKKLYVLVAVCIIVALLTALYAIQLNAAMADGKSKFLGNIIAFSVLSNFSIFWN
jgi:hypothetical protein